MPLRNRQPVAWNGNGTVAVWADEINESALNELGSWVPCSEMYFDIAPLPVRLIDDRFHCWVPNKLSPNSPNRIQGSTATTHEHVLTMVYSPPIQIGHPAYYRNLCDCGFIEAKWWVDPLDGMLVPVDPVG